MDRKYFFSELQNAEFIRREGNYSGCERIVNRLTAEVLFDISQSLGVLARLAEKVETEFNSITKDDCNEEDSND